MDGCAAQGQMQGIGTRIPAIALAAIALNAVFAAPAAARPLEGDPIGLAAIQPAPGSVVFPVRGAVGYGEGAARYGADRGARMHEGQDLFAPAGTPLVAVRDGVVLETGDDGGRGNYVALFSPAVEETYLYLHMLEPARLAPGDSVRAGSEVGKLGCSGSCFGDHLHFELRAGRGAGAPPRSPLALLRRSR